VQTANLISILNNYGHSTIESIKRNMALTGTNATGKTAKSLHYTVVESGDKITLSIKGKPYFAVVETGRKATPSYKPSYAFVASIKEWVKAKGLPEGSAYAIARSIHKKGTKLHEKGGRKDIITNVINQGLTDRIAQDVLKGFANLLATNIRQVYGRNGN
jgi:hypothetical protein